MNMGEILQNEINSALITCNNHNNDNGFLDCNVVVFENGLLERKYEPIGICKNIPFQANYAKYSIAFCYKYNDEIYWCHLLENIWYSLLSDVYGRKKANEIISKIMNY